ncbi:unnamed protein product [Caenorhabditis sp. 36 PRJEB53466]|nr:unnamed protein product [Caenorhabditis sp. 36 PRJEB53466]
MKNTIPSSSRISSDNSTASSAPSLPYAVAVGLMDYVLWPYTTQSTILFFLFIVWMIIGVFVAREVVLVLLDHRKIKRKPETKKSAYHGAYSVKRKRYVKDKNYEQVANGGNEIV